MVNITIGITNKPGACKALIDYFKSHSEYDGYLYIGFPLLVQEDGTNAVDAMWFSEKKGIVLFDLIKGS